jgi:DNA-binding response OmpR family regulator
MGRRILFFCSLSAAFHTFVESLRKNGHNVLWVVTLGEAASFVATAQFDLVLMSSERGHSELNALADLAEDRHLPFVIVGTATKDIECRALAVVPLSNTAKHLERWITAYLT